MFTTRDILILAALPFGAALVILLAAWRPWRRKDRPPVRGFWAGPLAAGAGLLAFALLDGSVPPWPPAEARHWLFYFVAALMLLGVFEALLHAWAPAMGWLRAEAALLLFAAGLYCLFQSLLRGESWTTVQGACHLLTMTVLVHAAWASSEVLVLRLPAMAGPLVLATFSGGVALVVMLSGSLVYGRLAGALAAATLASVVVAPTARGFSMARGGVTVIVPGAVCIMLLGHHYVDPGVTPLHAGLLLAALVLPWVATIRPLRRRRPWARTLLALVLAAAPAGTAVLLAQRSFARMQQETTPDPDAALYAPGAGADSR